MRNNSQLKEHNEKKPTKKKAQNSQKNQPSQTEKPIPFNHNIDPNQVKKLKQRINTFGKSNDYSNMRNIVEDEAANLQTYQQLAQAYLQQLANKEQLQNYLEQIRMAKQYQRQKLKNTIETMNEDIQKFQEIHRIIEHQRQWQEEQFQRGKELAEKQMQKQKIKIAEMNEMKKKYLEALIKMEQQINLLEEKQRQSIRQDKSSSDKKQDDEKNLMQILIKTKEQEAQSSIKKEQQ